MFTVHVHAVAVVDQDLVPAVVVVRRAHPVAVERHIVVRRVHEVPVGHLNKSIRPSNDETNRTKMGIYGHPMQIYTVLSIVQLVYVAY